MGRWAACRVGGVSIWVYCGLLRCWAEAACGGYAASVSFGLVRSLERARRWHIAHTPPPCRFRGSFMGKREVGGGVLGIHRLRVVFGVVRGMQRCWMQPLCRFELVRRLERQLEAAFGVKRRLGWVVT